MPIIAIINFCFSLDNSPFPLYNKFIKSSNDFQNNNIIFYEKSQILRAFYFSQKYKPL